MLLLTLLQLAAVAMATVPFRERSQGGDYKLKVKSVEAANALLDRVEGLQEKCSVVTRSLYLLCEGITKKQNMNILQQDDLLIFIDALKTIQTQTINKDKSSIKKRSVPWNLDRINQRSNLLDSSYKDDADVNVYIIGSGISVDHSEFENRASMAFSAFKSNSDCEGSGTELASLVGGRTVGVARSATLIGVKVIDCNGTANKAKIINGISFVMEEILKTSNDVRSVVLVGFTMDEVDKDINNKLVGLTEVGSGVIVIGGAGETELLDACRTTPASAQGATALNGIVTVGATDETDNTVSNIGECVDLFAPGIDIPAAGSGGPTDMSTCTGSLCAAALAAGVIANSLRQNSKISLEIQKSMLINGATVTNLKMPEKVEITTDNYDLTPKALLLLKARTPQKMLFSSCGYYRSEAPPVCESYTSSCNNSKVSSFDGNNVPIYQQKEEKCGFIVFQSEDNDVKVQGSYHKCSLAAYSIHWSGAPITLVPGPSVIVNGTNMKRNEISFEDDILSVAHVVNMAGSPREPVVVLTFKRGGEEEIRMEYDGTSRLRITLLKPDKYSGKTAGLCGYFDHDGTNDYLLEDGTHLSSYTPEFHESWMPSQECTTGCSGGECECQDRECQLEAEKLCKEKFGGATEECMKGVNAYKELQSCVNEVSKCCCQAKQGNSNMSPSRVTNMALVPDTTLIPPVDGATSMTASFHVPATLPPKSNDNIMKTFDIRKECCQNSFLGTFERNREGCNFCGSPVCIKEEASEHCVDNSQGREHYDYLGNIKYNPVNTCYFIPQHDTLVCTAPRNGDMMWDKHLPNCQEKSCDKPVVPNEMTLISPNKATYLCGETVTVTCTDCFKITPSQQVIACKAGSSEKENDAQWTDDVLDCEQISCPDPALPAIDDDINAKYPLSWIKPPYSKNCGDEVEFECDICYDMIKETNTLCQDSGTWTDSPSCKLRHCPDPNNPSLEYPLAIKLDDRACNDTINYHCSTREGDPRESKCYDLVGDSQSTCIVDPVNLDISWNSSRPFCDIRHCEALTEGDLNGEGWYQFTDPEDETNYIKVDLKDVGSNSPTECGSEVEVVCNECSFLCGPEKRTCQPDKSWSSGRPYCGIRLCETPDNNADVSNAVFTPTQGSYECGRKVIFGCKDECHEHAEGTADHHCRPDTPEDAQPTDSAAMWVGDPYSCIVKECPVLQAPTNGTISNPATLCGTLTLFSCDPCYELVGFSELKCRTNKTWSHEVPRCVKKECPIPGILGNGSSVVESVECGATVEHTCDSCFYLEGNSEASCQTDRTWSHVVPTCTQWQCQPRSHPPHGKTTSTQDGLCGDSVGYTCDNCYEMSEGSNVSTCVHGGSWSEEEPVCTIKTCSRPDVPANTSIIPDRDSYNCGDTMQVRCDPCFECNDTQVIECKDGGWDRAVPACDLKTCLPPGPLHIVNTIKDLAVDDEEAPGKLSWLTEEVVVRTKREATCGDSVAYECDLCYNLRGNKTVDCLQNKQWSSKPYCELKVCPPPEDPTEHLTLSTVKPTYSCNETIEYSCDHSCWYLEGPSVRRCSAVDGAEAGVWKVGSPPKCTIKQCPSLHIADELLEYTGGDKCGSTLTFTCPSCYKLVGSSTSTCLSDNEWDNKAPVCVPVCCPELSPPQSGDPSYDMETMSYKSVVAGSKLQKEVCGESHVCQKVEATCQECYEYHKGEKMYSMAPTRECKHPGNWTNQEEVCSRKQCVRRQLEKSQHIQYTEDVMEGMTECGNKVQFECDACHENVDGTMEHECLPSKEWSFKDVPVCTLKECPELPQVHESCRFAGDSRTCGASRQLQCDDCYYSSKCADGHARDTSVMCTVDKAWSWMVELPVVNIKTCDTPPEVENATFVSDGTDNECGRVVKYECDECFEFSLDTDCNCATVKCEGSNSDDCTKGSWVGTFPECNPKTCDPIEAPANARIVSNDNSCLGTFEMECNTGYELVGGDPIRTCLTNKEWSGSAPICRIRNCTQLQPPSYGEVSTIDRHYGTVVTFTCNECFEFPDSMTDPDIQLKKTIYPRYHILRCGEHGNWNGSEPVCQKKYCGKPNIPGNADITSMDFYCGDTIAYTCNTGYYHSSGDDVRECGDNSQWDGEDFACKVKTCEKPAEIENGDFSPELDGYTYKSAVTFDCDYCHQASGKLEITCEDYSETDANSFAQWDPEDLPKCSRIQCPATTAAPHSTLKPINHKLESRDCSQVLVAECDEGYQVKRSTKSIFCQSSGQWTGEVPRCERRCCDTRTKLENGLVTELNDKQCFGDKIKHECNSCYEMSIGGKAVPHSIPTCRADGSWSEELPFCKLIKCPATPFAKGNYSDSSYSGYCGTTRTFQCYSGYTLNGKRSITCLQDSNWSGYPPTCEPNPCSAAGLDISNGHYIPEVIGSAQPTVSSFEDDITDFMDYYPLWTLVYFGCNEGYELLGKEDLYCTEDGSWSGEPPRCTKEECPQPELPTNGTADLTHIKEGGIATYSCHECFRLDGYSVLTCSDGEWFPQQVPTCTQNVCYPPGQEENSYIVGYDSDKTTYHCGETVEYACDEGHQLHGTRNRTCSKIGQWSGNAPVCADVECLPIESPVDGGMKLVNGTNYVNFWCEKGYQISGDSQLLCVKGQWQGVEPRCTKQVCGDPGTPDWGTKTGTQHDYGSTVTFTCNKGYQLRGVNVISCNHRGEWDYTPPYCVCNECPRLDQPSNSYILTTDSNSYKSSVQYVCYPGFVIVGDGARECQASGVWSGVAPECQRLNCTENYKIPQGGHVFYKTGHSYEDTIEIKCADKKGSWTRTCEQDGMWSGDLPERCDCRREVKKVAVTKQVVKPAMCIFGKCHPTTTREIRTYEFKEMSVCDPL